MAMMLYSGLDWPNLIWDLLAVALATPTPETISTHVSYTAVDPMVIYAGFVSSATAVIVACLGVWSSYVNKKKIQEVHVLVNSQFQEYKDSVARILILEKEKSRGEGKESSSLHS
jgi:H+/gluconate symporter-like permease